MIFLLLTIFAPLSVLCFLICGYYKASKATKGRFRIRRDVSRWSTKYVLEYDWCGAWWEISGYSDISDAKDELAQRKLGKIPNADAMDQNVMLEETLL